MFSAKKAADLTIPKGPGIWDKTEREDKNMLKSKEYYQERGAANVALREEIEKTADQICQEGFGNIFFAGSGGSICMLAPFVEILKKRTTIVSYAEEAADLLVADYQQLNQDSLVVVVSKTGDAKEPMELVRYCREKGIRTVSFVGNNTSPVYLDSTWKIWIDEEVNAFRYMQLYYFMFRVMHNLGFFPEYDRFCQSVAALPMALYDAAVAYEPTARMFSRDYKDEPFILFVSSGIGYAEAFRFASCSLEEVFHIRTQAMNSAEFFHGCFEIVDEETPVVLIKNEDGARAVDERVEHFLNQYAKKYIVVDMKSFAMPGIQEEFRSYFMPAFMNMLLGGLTFSCLQETTGLGFHTRRYYRVVNY